MERTFIIQRYAIGNWDSVRGIVPFVVSGPRFRSHVVPGSLERFGEHRLSPSLEGSMREVMGDLGGDWRDAMAEWLLREGLVQALWSVDSVECLPEEERWDASVSAVAREIPKDGSVVDSTLELLSGISSPEHCRSYVSEDKLGLDPCPVP